MAQGMWGDWLRDSDSRGGLADSALDDGFVQVVTVNMVRGRIDVGASRREYPLPFPFRARIRILIAKRFRQFNLPHPSFQISRVQGSRFS